MNLYTCPLDNHIDREEQNLKEPFICNFLVAKNVDHVLTRLVATRSYALEKSLISCLLTYCRIIVAFVFGSLRDS